MPRALRVACGDGLWRFLQKGTGDDAVVYLHGWMSGSGTWRAVMERSHGPYRLLAPDLPGFGGTIPQRRFSFSVPAYAAAVADLLTTLAIKRATIVGWSFGGAVAMWMAAHHSDRVSRLVLINSAGGSPDMHLFHRIGGHRLIGAALWRLPRRVWDYFIRRAATGPEGGLSHMPRWFVDYHRGIVAKRWSRRAAHAALRWLVRLRREGRQALIDSVVGRIRQPTLILWGQNDRGMPPEHGIRLQQSIADARLHVLPDCAHCPPVEATDAVVRALNSFFAATSPSRRASSHGAAPPVPTLQDG